MNREHAHTLAVALKALYLDRAPEVVDSDIVDCEDGVQIVFHTDLPTRDDGESVDEWWQKLTEKQRALQYNAGLDWWVVSALVRVGDATGASVTLMANDCEGCENEGSILISMK